MINDIQLVHEAYIFAGTLAKIKPYIKKRCRFFKKNGIFLFIMTPTPAKQKTILI